MSEATFTAFAIIFRDLRFFPDEAAVLQMRADLMVELRKFIKNKKLTQPKAAEILGASHSRVSDLKDVKGKDLALRCLLLS